MKNEFNSIVVSEMPNAVDERPQSYIQTYRESHNTSFEYQEGDK